jgi:serine/threonine-protein kinase RsbW
MSVGWSDEARLLELSLLAVPENCARARRDVRAVLDGVRVDVAAVELALSEAVANAVLHAYRGGDGARAVGRVDIRVTADGEGVWVLVADQGVGMSPRDDSRGLGLGLKVIAGVSDQLLIVQGDTGTRVHMRFQFNGGVDWPG